MRSFLASTLIATTLVAAPASAATVIGGSTEVTLSSASALTALGLSFAGTGSTTVTTGPGGVPLLSFPITGGTVDDVTGDALLNHIGSGLIFTAGASTLSIGDFVVDTASGTLSGFATVNGANQGVVPLFTVDSSLTLSLSAQAAGAFTAAFGVANLTGVTIGTAAVSPVLADVGAIPEPATWAMMIAGFGLAGAAMRRSNRRVAVSFG